MSKIFSQFTALTNSLPPNVRILTLEPVSESYVLLRFEHFFETGESEKYSVPVNLDIQVFD